MVYSFALIKHANIRFRESVRRLGRYELAAMLHALGIDCDVVPEESGGADFLTFVCRPLSVAEIGYLSRHSSVSFMASKENGLLRPLDGYRPGYLPEDLPEVLKYKGKTSVPFTRMILNMALSLTGFVHASGPLTVMDPLCGKGTACFCAMMEGMNAVGLDLDRNAVREAADYFSRYLKYHQLKHSLVRKSETCGRTPVAVDDFVFADSKEHYLSGDTRSFRIAAADTGFAPYLSRRVPMHLIVADLPYGIQHAPQSGRKPETFTGLLSRALPAWKQVLAPGGALALSFNTLTLPTARVVSLLEKAGLYPCAGECFSHLRHDVEQAVVRDAVFALKDPIKEESRNE